MTAGKPVLVTLLIVLLVSGCAGSNPGPDAPRTPRSPVLTATDPFGCAPDLRTTRLPSGSLGKLFGHGPSTIVFANPSTDKACEWLPYAQHIADRGYTVLLFYYGSADRLTAVKDAVRLARDRGAAEVLLVGGSQGAGLAVAAAGQITPPLAGVAALSPGTSTSGVPSLSDAFAAVHVPLLDMMAVQDCDQQAGLKPCQAMFQRAPSKAKKFVPVPGTPHATAMLRGDTEKQATAALDGFIATYLPH